MSRAGHSRHGAQYWAARARGCLATLGPGGMAIDLVDRRDGDLIWRGWAEGAVLDARDAEDLDAYVDGAVRKILTTFPERSSQR